MIDLNPIETVGLLSRDCPPKSPFLSLYELAALFLFGPIRFYPLVESAFALVWVNFLQLKIVIFLAFKPPKLTVLYVPEGGKE